MRAAVAVHPEKLARRKTLIEHPWGTLKHILSGGFIVRGLTKVGAELSLAHFAYNLKRALAVVGLKKLLLALEGFNPGGNPASTLLFSLLLRLAALIDGLATLPCRYHPRCRGYCHSVSG